LRPGPSHTTVRTGPYTAVRLVVCSVMARRGEAIRVDPRVSEVVPSTTRSNDWRAKGCGNATPRSPRRRGVCHDASIRGIGWVRVSSVSRRRHAAVAGSSRPGPATPTASRKSRSILPSREGTRSGRIPSASRLRLASAASVPEPSPGSASAPWEQSAVEASGLHPPTRTTMPSADFSDAVGPPCEEPSPPMADTPETSRGKFDRLRRTPAESTPAALDGYGLCGQGPARPTTNASIRFLSIRPRLSLPFTLPPGPSLLGRLVRRSRSPFRPRLAATPLRLARTSPPSGCAGDFHPQVVEHARHTPGSRLRRRKAAEAA